MPTILPPKKDVALALLERASVFIHLDPRDPSVQVPSWFKRQPQLVLQVGLNMLVRIPDLDVGDEALACTLSFNRAPHYCYVPWRAVYALVGEDGRGMVWPEDIPPEVPAQASQGSQMQGSQLHGASSRPRLHSVPPLSAGPASVGPASAAGPASAGWGSSGPNSAEPASKKPASSAAGSRRLKFRVTADSDAKGASSVRSPSLFPPAPDSAGSRDSNRGASASRRDGASKQDGPPVLALSGSKRRRANAERKGDSRLPPASSQGGAAESESAVPSQHGAASEPVALPSASSSSDSHTPLSSADSQERSSRSSERPYLRLVR